MIDPLYLWVITPNLAILRHALLRDRTFSLGAMVARWLSLNRTKGPMFGGIYASGLARHFEIPIRHDERERICYYPLHT